MTSNLPEGFVVDDTQAELPQGFTLDEMTVPEKIKGTAGMVSQMITGAIAEPIAGLGGIAGSILPGEQGQGAEWVKNIQEALTPTPSEETIKVGEAVSEYMPDISGYIGGQVLEATGNPELATIAHTAPEALMQWLGLKAPSIASKLSKRGQRLASQDIEKLNKEIADFKASTSSMEGVTDVADTIKQSPSKAVELAEFDEKVLKAADDLGLTEIPPSVAAGNAQFRDIAQGLASMPGTQAKAQYGSFLEALGDKADDIIVSGGGDSDKAAVSQRFRDVTKNTMDELSLAESKLYDEIDLKINKSQIVEPESLRSFVDEKITEFGGVEDMPKVFQDINKLVNDVDGMPKSPTYAAFNQKRKDIGAAIGRKQSPYADSELSSLKEAYGRLKSDQNDFSESFGAGELQQAADALTIKRKALENTTTDLLGKKLNKDLMPEVSTKIAGLPKGNVTKFIETVEGIPKSIRGEVVVSGLNDLLKGTGADQKSFGSARFVGLMNNLNRNSTAKKALYKYLPKKTQQSLDNFYKLASAAYKANKENITTGKIATFFPDQRSFINKLISRSAATVAASKTGIAGAEAVDAIGDFLSNTTPSANRANDLISSPKFQSMMREAVRDGVHEAGVITEKTKKIERLVKKSSQYKKWAENLDGNQKAELLSLGLVNYLTQDTEQETTNKEGNQ